MLNRLREMMSSGPEALQAELLEFAKAEGYHLEGLVVRGNVIKFQVIDREQGRAMMPAAELFCNQYNFLYRKEDESKATVIEGDEGIFVELNASRH